MKKILLLCCIFLCGGLNVVAQVNNKKKSPTPKKEKVYEKVETMPAFPGGETGLIQWLNQNINYPDIAQRNNIQGHVLVQFVVGTDGSITDIKVVQSVDPALDQEAKRVISTMPKWQPGTQKGKPVNCLYTMPVTFRLQ